MASHKTFLAFTSGSYVYDNSKEKVTKRLVDEMAKHNARATHCCLVDVTHLDDNTEIYHDDVVDCIQNGVKTSDGEILPVQLIEL